MIPKIDFVSTLLEDAHYHSLWWWKALVAANPLGSSALEKTDCTAFASDFARYAPGSALAGKKARK